MRFLSTFSTIKSFRIAVLTTGLAMCLVRGLLAADNVAELSELPNEIIVDILHRMDYSNDYLVSLYRQGGKLKSVSKMMMMDRMRKWGHTEPEKGLESSQQILDSYAEYFIALHEVWTSGKPVLVTFKSNLRPSSVDILGFDPFDVGRMVTREELSDQSEKIRLWDFAKGVTRSIYQLDLVPSRFQKVFFLSWDPKKLVLQLGRKIIELDISETLIKEKLIANSFRAIDGFIDQKYRRFVGRDISQGIKVFDLANDKEPITLSHDRAFKLLQEKVDERASFASGHYLSISKDSIKRWDRSSLELISEMPIANPMHDSHQVSIYYQETKPEQLTLIGSTGLIQNIDVVANEILATGVLPYACQHRRHMVSVAIGRQYIGISCGLNDLYLLDRDELNQKGVIRSPDAIAGKLYNLPGSKERYISWSLGETSMKLFDAKEKSYLGKLGGQCTGNFFERVCRHLGAIDSKPYQIRHIAISPWDQDKVITSNGSNIGVWDLDAKRVELSEHPHATLHSGQKMHLNPYSPNSVLLLNADGSFVAFDYWEAAKNLVSNRQNGNR